MSKQRKSKSQGKFFAIDRRIWSEICDTDNINQASAYLVLGCGTDSENRLSTWSASAAQKYAGMRWDRAKNAISGLTKNGFMRLAPGSIKDRPQYELLSHVEIERAKLRDHDRSILAKIESGKTTRDWFARERLQKIGLIVELNGTFTAATTKPELSELIWLPNTLVTGTANEESPVKRLRAGGCLWTLRLLVDLYHVHNLRDDGGVYPEFLRCDYGRKLLVGEHKEYKVWSFQATTYRYCGDPCKKHENRPQVNGDAAVWDSIERLGNEGLLSFVPHVFERGWDSQAPPEIIHAYGNSGNAEDLERQLAEAAHRAGLAMVPDFKVMKARAEGFRWLIPVRKTRPDVQMIGVARLRYRPHTKRTGEWYKQLAATSRTYIEAYDQMEKEAKIALSKSA